MTTPADAYWDELGVAWRVVHPETDVIMPRLKSRLRRQSLLIVTALVVGLPLSVSGFVLGMLTIWNGWTTGTWNFLTRGMAIGAISAILAIAVSLLLPVRAGDAAKALPEMIDLALARARRMLVAIQLGYYACAVAAVFGLAGTAIRTYFSGPPRLSPVIDLAVLAVFALGLFVYNRHLKVQLEKLHALKQALSTDGGA